MKESKFTDAQKAVIIRQGEDGTPVADICRKAGVSQATYFSSKKKYAGMMPSEMKRLRELEDENGRLGGSLPTSRSTRRCFRTSCAESSKACPEAQLVHEMRTTSKVSVRKACRVLRFDPKSYRYRSRRPGQAPLDKRIKEICQTRVRYGYRRVHVMLRREGSVTNEKRTQRVYNQMGMQLRNKTPKRRVKAALRADRTPPSRSNEVWAMNFVDDQLAMGTKLRILAVIDTFSRYAPVVDPRFAYRGADVVATLERVCKVMGYPSAIRVDQGSEFVSRDLDLWAYQNNVTLDFSRPGKPTDNAFIEAFNGRLRAECLADARETLSVGVETTTR